MLPIKCNWILCLYIIRCDDFWTSFEHTKIWKIVNEFGSSTERHWKHLRMLVTILKQIFLLGLFATVAFCSLFYEMFMPTRKPLQCHESNLYKVRSVCECALICRTVAKTCAGYSLTKPDSCDVCFIYDVKYRRAALWTLNITHSAFLPVINKTEGELPIKNISFCSFCDSLVSTVFKIGLCDLLDFFYWVTYYDQIGDKFRSKLLNCRLWTVVFTFSVTRWWPILPFKISEIFPTLFQRGCLYAHPVTYTQLYLLSQE